MKRTEILSALAAQISAGVPILGFCAGTGLTAKCSEKGGADLIFLNNAGRFRMAGRSTLLAKFSFGNANEVTQSLINECVPILSRAPVVAGVFAQDPFRNIGLLLRTYVELGVSGIQNSPTLGMMKPAMAKNLESGMMGMSMEYKLIEQARELDLFTAPIAHTAEQAERFIDAGADLIVATAGVTVAAEDRVPLPDKEANFSALREIAVRAKARDRSVFVTAHGGILSTPDLVQEALFAIPELDGFVGGSAIERIPVESAIRQTIVDFKQVR